MRTTFCSDLQQVGGSCKFTCIFTRVCNLQTFENTNLQQQSDLREKLQEFVDMAVSNASLYPVFLLLAQFLGPLLVLLLLQFWSTKNGPRLDQCGVDSTDYAIVFHSTREEVCCRKRICPPGHYAEPCSSDNPESTSCRPCPPGTYQPIPNQLGTKCIKKKLCDGLCTRYNHRGTSTEDAECECKQGCYWNEESSSCKKNKLCPPGYGIDDKGGCMECSPGTFSDTYDNLEKCPHTKCKKFNRWVRIPGIATDDNVCSDQPQTGIGSANITKMLIFLLGAPLIFAASTVIAHLIHFTVISLPIQVIRISRNIKGSTFTFPNSSNLLYLRRGSAKSHTPIRRSDCKCESLHPRGSHCSDKTNNQYGLDEADFEKTPCSTTEINIVPRTDPSEANGAVNTSCSAAETNNLPWTYPSEAAGEPRVSQDEKTEGVADFKAWPNKDEALLPVTKSIDDSSECTTIIPMGIPERLEKILWQFNFVHILGCDKGSLQVYVLSQHFGKHTELEVKNTIKSLAKAHGMDCDVIVSETPKGLSSMCGKKPSRPGAKIVINVNDENRFGSLGGYFRTSEEDSPVYVITNEHVANKDDYVRVVQSSSAGIEDTCTEVHFGTCRWAIKTGSTPSRYVDIAAIEVPTLGWRPGIKDGPGESIFKENINNVIGKLVFKYGAQTGLTYGIVKDVERSTDKEGNDLMFVIVEGIVGTFCAGGDSGSFVRLEDGRKLLAMVMGGELKYKKAANGDSPNASVCYVLSKGLLELEKMSQLKWIPEDEAHIQCLLQDHE